MFKAYRPTDTPPNSSRVPAAYILSGPSDTFTLRYISIPAFSNSSFWLPSPVSKLLGYPMKLCLLDVNDYLKRPYEVVRDDYMEDPFSTFANRFMTVCDVMSEDFGKVYGRYFEGKVVDELRGTALMVCEDGRVPDLKFLECMNAFIKKHVVLMGIEVERLRKQEGEVDLAAYRQSVKDVFSTGGMQDAWKEYQRKEAKANAKFEADKKAAESQLAEGAEGAEGGRVVGWVSSWT